jgi:predicted DNA-binding WGR domain protein
MWQWTNPENGRYYQADLVLDLFGNWSLVLAWGGLGSNRGSMRTTSVPSHEDGLKQIMKIDKRRKQRGYLGNSNQIT